MIDYKPMAVNDRILAALQECTGSGVPASKVQTLLAIAGPESGDMWVTARTGLWIADTPCWPSRTIIGYEPAGLRDLRFQKSVLADGDAITFLSTHGWLRDNGVTYVPDGTFYSEYGHDSDAVATFFEWVFENRKGALLDNFSLGPTQMYLAQTQMYIDSGGTKGTTQGCGFPSTWDELWTFYTQGTVPGLMDLITYLDPACTGITTGYPADHPNDDSANIAFLCHQVGTGGNCQAGSAPDGSGRSYADYYWEHTPGDASTGISGWLERVSAIRNKYGVAP